MRKAKVPPGIPEPVLQGSERSALFWFLYQHHDTLLEKWSGRRVDWNLVSAWAEAQQAWDRNEQTPRPNTARKTWERVRTLVAHEKAEREAKPRPVYLRSPASSQAPAVAPRVTNPPNRSHPAPAQVDAGQGFDADEYIAEMRADLAHRSGRR